MEPRGGDPFLVEGQREMGGWVEVRAELEELGRLAHSAPTSVGALPLGADTLLPRARRRSYRERESALTESVKALLPRARKRSYRERESALTESAEALLPRARKRSYRERPPPLRTSDKQVVRRAQSSAHICSHMRAVSSFAWGEGIYALGIEPISCTHLGKDWGELEQGGGACPLGRP